MFSNFRNSTVLITGNSGFKGSWLSAWLLHLGARVVGLSLNVPTTPSHFLAGGFSDRIDLEWGNICDPQVCKSVVKKYLPDFVFHLAAQPLVRHSYLDPYETFRTNTGGIDLNQDVCGFMLETFQGWGAVFYPKDFVQAIENVCRKNGILLAFDEMQAGFGRTGKKFGFQHYEVTPDLICTGKGMGGGVPLSGVIGRADIMDLPEVGNMSSTHSANPLVCAAGLAVLEELESRNLVAEAERKGKLFRDALESIQKQFPDRISWILGNGMIMAVLFKEPATGKADGPFTSRVAERCMQKGVLVVHTGRESIKLGPPLTITDEALLEGTHKLQKNPVGATHRRDLEKRLRDHSHRLTGL